MTDAEREEIANVAYGIAAGTRLFQQTMGKLGQPIGDEIMLAAVLTLSAAMLRDAPAEWRKDAVQQFILACEPLPARHDA